MKSIYSLFLLICLVQYSLSSSTIIIEILGGVAREYNQCSGENFVFFIPASITGLEEGQTLNLEIPLASPKDLTAKCVKYESEGSSLHSTDEYLQCTINSGSVLIYKEQLSFYPTYTGPEDFTVEGWEEFIGKDPVIDPSATCPVPVYEFTEINTITDQCSTEYPEYHLLQAYGKLVVNTPEDYLRSTDIDLNFKMYLYVNSALVEATCKITEVDQEQNSSNNGFIQCLFVGDGNVQFPRYMAVADNDYIYIENTEAFPLTYQCKKPTPGPEPTPTDVPTKSSWLSVSVLLIFALILL